MILNCIILGIVALAQGVVAYKDCESSRTKGFPYRLREDGVDEGYSSSRTFDIVVPKARICGYAKIETILRSTGLYAPGCSIISLKYNKNGTSCRHLAVQISNLHKGDMIQGLTRRPKNIATHLELTRSGEMELEAEYGGIIYLNQFGACNSDVISLSISASKGYRLFKSPLFETGVTNKNEWNNKLRNGKAAWGLINTKTTEISIPMDILRNWDGDQIEKMSKKLDTIVNTLYDISGITRYPGIVLITADDTPADGKGYPIVLTLEHARHLADEDLFMTNLGSEILDTLASNFYPEAKDLGDVRRKLLAKLFCYSGIKEESN